LEFSASVGLVHRESVTMHCHTVFKKKKRAVTHFDMAVLEAAAIATILPFSISSHNVIHCQ